MCLGDLRNRFETSLLLEIYILSNRLRVELVVVIIAFVGLGLELPLGLLTLCSFIRYTLLEVSLLTVFIFSRFINRRDSLG